jgi:hypothetical protein
MALTQTFPTSYAYNATEFVNASYWVIAGYTEDRSTFGTIVLAGYKNAEAAHGKPLAKLIFTVSGEDYSPAMANVQLEAFIMQRPEWADAVQS